MGKIHKLHIKVTHLTVRELAVTHEVVDLPPAGPAQLPDTSPPPRLNQ
jgi:hypothetical protein